MPDIERSPLCSTCAQHPAAARLGLSICVICAGVIAEPGTFTLTDAGRAKLAAAGIEITADDERRAGWTPHDERPISAVTETKSC
jgi:hypothetical protein